MIRRVGWGVALITLAASGAYTLVYVARWEWNRAQFAALVFIAIEVGIALALVMTRLSKIDRRLRRATDTDATVRALGELEATAPTRRHFAWLERSMGQTNVFITILLGAGLLLSGLVWLVDRIATRTARPTLERALARRLAAIEFPDRPLVPEDEQLLAQGGPYARDPALAILLGPGR